MTLNEYQRATGATANYPTDRSAEYLTLGLCGEAGEVANNIKKELRDGVDLSHNVLDELGDVFWYLAQLAEKRGHTLEEVAAFNLQKLRQRHEQRERRRQEA
jgi:NTP pyrophosphatase (non-canonical NTP hydrolase)